MSKVLRVTELIFVDDQIKNSENGDLYKKQIVKLLLLTPEYYCLNCMKGMKKFQFDSDCVNSGMEPIHGDKLKEITRDLDRKLLDMLSFDKLISSAFCRLTQIRLSHKEIVSDKYLKKLMLKIVKKILHYVYYAIKKTFGIKLKMYDIVNLLILYDFSVGLRWNFNLEEIIVEILDLETDGSNGELTGRDSDFWYGYVGNGLNKLLKEFDVIELETDDWKDVNDGVNVTRRHASGEKYKILIKKLFKGLKE